MSRGTAADNAAVPKFELLTPEDLAALPDLEWLIEGVLPTPGLVVLYGEPGCGKTFVALSMALTVASGLAWLGRATRQTKALYIAAEGVRGATLEKVALPGGKTSLIIGDTFDILRATGAHADKIVEILSAQFAESGATHGQLKKAFVAGAGNSASTFDRTWRDLKETDRVRVNETGPRSRYYPAAKD